MHHEIWICWCKACTQHNAQHESGLSPVWRAMATAVAKDDHKALKAEAVRVADVRLPAAGRFKLRPWRKVTTRASSRKGCHWQIYCAKVLHSAGSEAQIGVPKERRAEPICCCLSESPPFTVVRLGVPQSEANRTTSLGPTSLQPSQKLCSLLSISRPRSHSRRSPGMSL